ncbi:MAG: hypothetical protein ACN4GR_17355 [Arenicellales bacterium]
MPASDFYITVGKKWTAIYQGFVDLMYGAIARPLSATSTTSLTIAAGTKTLTCEIEKSFSPGQPVRLYHNSTNYMDGVIDTYDSTTGAMDVSITSSTGSGTYASWFIGLVGSTVPVDKSFNMINVASNLTLTAGDLSVGLTILLVDPSSGNIIITLPTAAVLAGKIVLIKIDNDPAGNRVVVNRSDGSELYTGYAKDDFVNATSGGTDYKILDELVTARGVLAKTLDQTILSGAGENIFAADYVVDEDYGNWANTTLHQADVEFDCRIKLKYPVIVKDGFAKMVPDPWINGTPLIDAAGSDAIFMLLGEFETNLSAGDNIKFYVRNNGDRDLTVCGDAAKDESKVSWEVVKRLR